MAEYIERGLTIQLLCEACSNFEGNICTLSEECEDIRIIKDMPAADVLPVRRGKMTEFINKEIAIERIDRIKPQFVMSEYGLGYLRGLNDAIGILNNIPAADMRKKEENNEES